MRRRKGHRLKKSAEALDDPILRKIRAPDVQISLIRHIGHYSGMRVTIRNSDLLGEVANSFAMELLFLSGRRVVVLVFRAEVRG